MPDVVVEADGAGLDLGVQLLGAQLNGEGDPAVLQGHVEVVVLIA